MRERKTRTYEPEFRYEAVALVERTGRAVHAVARDLGIPTGTLRNWYFAEVSKKQKQKKARPPLETSERGTDAGSTEARICGT